MSRRDELLAAIQPLKAFAKKYGYGGVNAWYREDEEFATMSGYTHGAPHDEEVVAIFREEAANGRQA